MPTYTTNAKFCMYMCLATLHSRPSYISLTYHELAARPDGSDIFWPVEVDDSNGTLQYRYPLGPPPFGIDLTNSRGNSIEDVSEESRSRRAATKYHYALWPSGIVYYVISLSFSGESCILIAMGALFMFGIFYLQSYRSPFIHLYGAVMV